ncbi:hypothetical protein EC957_000191 [Mortierella hygrophila]|uniref:Uncharacterized protein n=1 Tax=Mortierella hygrophila TaxID=979708 RepID=A0A9P6K7F2_9FUNG|nr:hypothetical protein EC957_000191 [Mortierella hygrophila]
MDFNIPAYTYPCLAPSFYSNTPQLIFLFGVPDGTPTLVSHLIDISNIDAPKVSYITSDSKADRQYKWDPKAEKSCFTNPMSFTSGGYANTEVQQLGTTTVAAILSASFGLQQVFDLSMVKFKTSKLFASTRVQGRDDYAVAWAAFTVADAVGGAPAEKEGWVGVFRNTSNIIVTDQGQTNLPPSPTLAVGAYSTTNANGDLAVYDKDGAGYLYRASSVSHPPGANAPVAWLYSGQKQPIDSGGAALTSEAIPISAQNIAFILDQTPDNLTVVYSLRPDSSPKLVKVATKGNLPPFIKNMAGTVLDEYSGISEKIVIYSLDQTTGAARLNLFDTVTGIWTGSGLVDPSSEPATASPLLPPRKIITLGQAADNASDISAGRNETGAGSNEPSAPAAISNDINNNQLPVFWVL